VSDAATCPLFGRKTASISVYAIERRRVTIPLAGLLLAPRPACEEIHPVNSGRSGFSCHLATANRLLFTCSEASAPWLLFRCSEETAPTPHNRPRNRLDRAASGMDRLTGDAAARLVKALGRKAGLAREVRPHGLRHEAITRARVRRGRACW